MVGANTLLCGRLFIDGRWQDGAQREPNHNPSDLSDRIGDYAWASAQDAERALAAARSASTAWSRSNPQLRTDILVSVADAIRRRSAELARVLAREEGKVLKDAEGEVIRAAQIFQYYAGMPTRTAGGFFPSTRPGFNITVEHEPLGVVTLITPWNFPIAIPAWKIAPALACGNTVVFKPSEYTPGIAVALTEILIEAGVPTGVFNLVMGSGAALGNVLVDGADGVSFTGATPTGRAVLARAARRMTKVQMELGGKNPLVVLDDADLDRAIDVAFDGTFAQAGQRCTASSRLIVTRGIHDAFVAGLAAKLSAARIGHALDADSDIGPLANQAQIDKSLHYIADAQREGAELFCGGERLQRRTDGYYLSPALFVDTDNAMRINREEVFGPVGTVIRVDDLDEAIAVAGDCDYALSSGVCTRSLAAAEHFRRAAKSGIVTVNAPTSGAEYHVPFGGRAPSGYGAREQGASTAEFFTETKTTYVHHGVA